MLGCPVKEILLTPSIIAKAMSLGNRSEMLMMLLFDKLAADEGRIHLAMDALGAVPWSGGRCRM